MPTTSGKQKGSSMRGFIQSLIVGPFKGLTVMAAIVYIVAGAAAAASFVFLVFSIVGLVLGWTVGGAPVIVSQYHVGQAQMKQLMAEKGIKSGTTACPKPKAGGKATPPRATDCR